MTEPYISRSSEKLLLLEEVLDHAEIGIHLVNRQYITIYYNRIAEKIDGLSKDEVIGKNMKELVDSGIFSQSVAVDVLSTRKEKEIVQRVNDRYVRANGVPLYKNGRFRAVVVYTVDINTVENLSNRVEELRKRNKELRKELNKYKSDFLDNQLLFKSKKMHRVVDLGEKVAKVNSTILLEGESGVGKTLFANHIHEFSNRSNKPFVKVDCSAIPENLFESEVFGYEPGSFTGALESGKEGLAEVADGGTLFLDEIAEVPINSQVKLLTLLQEKTIQRVGSTKRKKVDIRVIAATNQDLIAMVEEGRFRQDLYYRLKVIPIVIPPLREREADILPLIKLFCNKLNNYYDMKKTVSPKGINALINYSWPGNVRELENVIERLVVTSEFDVITEEEVLQNISLSEHENTSKLSYRDRVVLFEKNLIEEESKNVSSIRELSKSLKINESTLRKKIERFGIDMKY